MNKEYGHYDDERREYVITDPATPWPWINYLGCEDFFSLISNTAGGYCFCRDAKFRRILRYRYNSVPTDSGGRYFYIKDGDTVWSPGWKPCRTHLDFYECRHGLGYTEIIGEKDGVRADVTFFVPVGRRCEVHRVVISNSSDKAKSLKLFSFVEWCLWNASTDMENFQRNLSTGEVEIEGSVIYHNTEYKERRNHYAFYGVNAPVDGFDTDRESFLGAYNGFEAPSAVMNGSCTGSIAHGWSPIASHQMDIDLLPGESRELDFVLGYVENPQEDKFAEGPVLQSTPDCPVINKTGAHELLEAFSTPVKVSDALGELAAFWTRLLENFSLESDDPALNRSINVWNQYQCMVTFNMSRSASFFESGIGRGMGFRDSNQDLIGFVHQIPAKARRRILDLAATQLPDGSCYHQFQPLNGRGNNDIGSGFNDDPLWLIFGTVAYIKETGDFGILDEMVPFDNVPGSEAPLLEHLWTSFTHVDDNLGPHGLPLIGHADWNDCLNLNCFSTNPDESFQTAGHISGESQAESLMIAGQFVFCCRQFADLIEALPPACGGQAQKLHLLSEAASSMCRSVKEYGWDGEWFLRAYDYHGGRIGTSSDKESRIFIESQGWCSMARIGASDGLCDKALDSVKRYLDSPYGLVLNYPAYSSYHPEYGEISSYPKGYKENGGVFTHNNPWIIIAEVMAGRFEDAWEHYRKICPAYITDQRLHRIEPYVYSQMVAGKEAALPGEGKNSWLSGTAAWAWYAATQYILGIRPEYNGLTIDPATPASLGGWTVTRKLRDAVYEIHYSGNRPSAPLFVPYSPGHHIVEL